MIRNLAVLFGALIAAVLAMQPVLWVTSPGPGGRSARDVGGIIALHAISALPSVVAAIVFAALAAWGLKTQNQARALWLTVATVVVLRISSIRYVAPDLMAWSFIVGESVVIAAFAFATFKLVRNLRASSEAAV